MHEHVNRVGVAEPIAGRQRVARVQLRRIIGTERSGDAPLGVARVALGSVGFGENDDVAGLRERQRGAQAGDATADDEKLAAHIHFGILPMHNARGSMINAAELPEH